ncbi:hypothetical protein TRFO_25788 [Tritrichomonas foetus]|uniref:Uncharacterized protein n=1 Tax=Tritrichomonas foetus TaxID=1144522 RepID=A0A1J4K4C0_9EUKA|nr:hypothetical protein TRFO_25788 [Tritrichomonas foetus]|eukprot:OHT06231.1 hypothetical protein TRFO_25788 [Tritrichomonas foetus]
MNLYRNYHARRKIMAVMVNSLKKQTKYQMVSLTGYKAIYSFSFFTAHILGSFLGTFLKKKKYSTYMELFSGGFLLSLGLNHIYRVSSTNPLVKYPYASVATLVIFTFLTLFTFLRESISLMDDNILTTCEIGQNASASNSEYDAILPHQKPQFHILENLSQILYYVISLFAVISLTISISRYSIDQLNENVPFFVIFRLFESSILSFFLFKMPLKKLYKYILIFVFSLPSFLIFLSNTLISEKSNFPRYFLKSCFSMLLGVYFYFGATSVHRGISSLSESFVVPFSILALSFISSFLLKIKINYNY